ncbi:MAG TPA: sugar ABC transporter permease [Gemmatimonadaceae bacterium]|jgi:multiple sugar transport system permease protein
MSGRRIAPGWWFAAPALVLVVTFFLGPVAAAVGLSFTDFDLYALADWHAARWVGVRNYVRVLHEPVFWVAVRNTLYFALVGGPLTVAASLGTALLVNSRLLRYKATARTIFFAPFVTTLVAVAIVWRYLYHPRYGLINSMLGHVGIRPIDWLGNPHWAMPAIILMATWKNFGYNMLICIAGLQSIPRDLYEAAELDGAGGWSRFRHITLPMLGPTLFFVAVVTMIGYLQLFTEPYVMTQGGPLRATTSLALYMYEEGFRWWRLGNAAAIAFLLFVLISMFTLVQRWLTPRAAA